ncbi:WecB/TagA/CpsF family glycosyltransferase [Euzebya rosea]|uniref:WecB/TagA/CpsF family glycosyltransferase n=1 Tax=Euzebya rosea TaxID=2052804 RepID=UPI001300AF4A|nr:WecB/TagA/CpsF family glycosyltransferase [Euzebya rosea]
MTLPPRVDLLGVPLSATSYADVLELIDTPPVGERARTLAFCNVHSVMTARGDETLRTALRELDVTTTDGMPLVWALRRLGVPDQERVYGPDLMEMALPHGVDRGWRHYFYGAAPETLEKLLANVRASVPGIDIVGSHSPPYRALSEQEEEERLAEIRDSGATHVWVGLGMPKQELFVHRVADRLPGQTLLAVGAAFDMHAGVVSQAPDWIQDKGLEWAYRWAQEPRRLTSRYLVNNPMFLLLLALQLLRSRLGGHEPTMGSTR